MQPVAYMQWHNFAKFILWLVLNDFGLTHGAKQEVAKGRVTVNQVTLCS